MQVAAEIRRSRVKNPKAVELKHFMIKFERQVRKAFGSKEEAAEASKSLWMGRLGVKRDKTDTSRVQRLKSRRRNPPKPAARRKRPRQCMKMKLREW